MKTKKEKMFALMLLIATLFTVLSCEKEEPVIAPAGYEQQVVINSDNKMLIGGEMQIIPSIEYDLIVFSTEPVDEVKLNLKVNLKDGSQVLLTETMFPNFAQSGIYAPNYKHKKYWVIKMETLPMMAPEFTFISTDIISFNYEAAVRISESWYDVPAGTNKVGEFNNFFLVKRMDL